MRTKLLCFLMAVCSLLANGQSRLAMRSESSTNLENYHVFGNSRGKYLYNLNAYNSVGTVYCQIYDSYTAALPGTEAIDTVTPSTDLFVAPNNHSTWTNGTRVTVTSSGTMPAPLVSSNKYWLIQVALKQFKVADSLDNALRGTNVDITSAGSGTITFSVLTNNTTMPITPTKITVNATGSYTFNTGRPFTDGIYAVFSSTDTNFSAIATSSGLFDAVYGQ
jgi:hypothetical protein